MTARGPARTPQRWAPRGRPTPRGVLEDGLRAFFGRPLRVVRMECEPLETSSHTINRLRVTLGSGEQLPVIFKRLRPGRKPYGNEREVLVYRQLLKGGFLGAPALYASAYDEARGRYWLFLEDVGSQTLRHAETAAWFAAARWLGELHAAFWGREGELRALGCLPEHGPDFYHRLAQTARRFLRLGGVPGAVARFDELMIGYDRVVTRLAREPRALIHGDIFFGNLMLGPGPSVRVIDWESAAIGLPALDLVRFLDGWEERHRGKVIAEYLAGFARRSPAPPNREAFDRLLELCELLNLLCHLGWEVKACANRAFVEGGLADIEVFWERLREAPHG
jgi:Phosphotransferase enzyme family